MHILMEKIEPRFHDTFSQRKAALLVSFMPEAQPDSKEQQLSAINNQLDKMDINEEIVRFKAHMVNFEKILHDSDQEKGKRLDFYLQELWREINTMVAKSNDSVLTSFAIDIKVELEKARELVQNII
jgi:uncharacterized protein (TIGR00255 family)